MDFTILLAALLPFGFFFIYLLYYFHRVKKAFNTLARAANKLGLSKFHRIWISQASLQGKLNGFDATLEASFHANGANLTLRLQFPSTYEIVVRRSRYLWNLDLGDLLLLNKRPTKVSDLVDKEFEVFSDNKMIARKVISDLHIKELLKHCIQDQKDSLEISRREIVLKHLVSPMSFIYGMDSELLELDLNAMWSLVDSILSHLNKAPMISEYLICPFCHDRVLSEAILIECDQCSTIHHEGCWNENGKKCAVYRCTGYIGEEVQLRIH